MRGGHRVRINLSTSELQAARERVSAGESWDAVAAEHGITGSGLRRRLHVEGMGLFVGRGRRSTESGEMAKPGAVQTVRTWNHARSVEMLRRPLLCRT